MADLTAGRRASMPQSQFGMPGKRFPMNDANHQRLAISGATRSERAGNISASTAANIKAKARTLLGKRKQSSDPAEQPHPRQHALSMASATHLLKQGHITPEHHEKIHKRASIALAGLRQQQGGMRVANKIAQDEGQAAPFSFAGPGG